VSVPRWPGTKEVGARALAAACTSWLAIRTPTVGLRYRAINACIRLLPTSMASGLQVNRRELKANDGPLQIRRSGRCRFHGSHALLHAGLRDESGSHDVQECRTATPAAMDALSGNLCPMHGYRPSSLAGAEAMHYFLRPMIGAAPGVAPTARATARATRR